ncbi:hypothetical protein [Gracilimonas sediminicola]|uniref:Uncharacterized protein n=1 Tax=Gracilimonas sediminicola TaxID=2952158 RepID=A0A9X2L1C7_9BACT|nr:hypothetical protein [Gracilimonas sediminicola]MCP9290477.1 hypothetical protein [Gracilimonas sediminicola]
MSLSFGCKRAPTLSLDNELDPQAPSFKPIKPYSLESRLVPYNWVQKSVFLEWRLRNGEGQFVDGYVISKSEIDSTNHEIIALKSKREYNSFNYQDYFKFEFHDKSVYNGVYAHYKIQSFYVQDDDTAYSDPVFTSFEAMGFQIDLIIEPFKQEPYMTFNWSKQSLTANDKIEFYYKEFEHSEPVLIGEDSIFNESKSFVLNLNLNPDSKYFYRIVRGDIEGYLNEIYPLKYLRDLYFLDGSEFSENDIELQIGFRNDTSYVKPVIESYQVRISETPIHHSDYATDPDTTFFKAYSGGFSPPSEEVLITGLNESKLYLTELFGVRGAYHTHKTWGTLYFDSTSTGTWRLNTDPW